MNRPGQAEYMLAVMSAMTERLKASGVISYEQKNKIDKLNEQTVRESQDRR